MKITSENNLTIRELKDDGFEISTGDDEYIYIEDLDKFIEALKYVQEQLRKTDEVHLRRGLQR